LSKGNKRQRGAKGRKLLKGTCNKKWGGGVLKETGKKAGGGQGYLSHLAGRWDPKCICKTIKVSLVQPAGEMIPVESLQRGGRKKQPKKKGRGEVFENKGNTKPPKGSKGGDRREGTENIEGKRGVGSKKTLWVEKCENNKEKRGKTAISNKKKREKTKGA